MELVIFIGVLTKLIMGRYILFVVCCGGEMPLCIRTHIPCSILSVPRHSYTIPHTRVSSGATAHEPNTTLSCAYNGYASQEFLWEWSNVTVEWHVTEAVQE